MDGVTQDAGEFYDGENEGDDRRNESNTKRVADSSGHDQIEAKKAKTEEVSRTHS